MDGTRKLKVLLSLKYPLPSCLVSSVGSFPCEPTSFTQANTNEHWRQAMSEEFNSLVHNQTWSSVPSDPSMNIVGCKWAYRLKQC